jgi:hypothetical protein
MTATFTALAKSPFSVIAGATSKVTIEPSTGGLAQSSDRKEKRFGRPGEAMKSGRRFTTFPILRVVDSAVKNIS